MSNRASLLSAFFVFVGIAFGCVNGVADNEKAMDATMPVSQITNAIRAANWIQLQPYCLRRLMLVQYVRVNAADTNLPDARHLFPATMFIDGHSFGADVEGYASEYQIIDTRSPLHGPAQKAFFLFCGYVKGSFAHNSPWVKSGHVTDDEIDAMSGPAIEGKIASNERWRIELVRVAGAWKISRLIVTAH